MGHDQFCNTLGEHHLGPGARRGSQPHEHRPQRQSLVVGRAGKRSVEPLCRLFRRRLGTARTKAAQSRADADSGRSLRPRDRRAANSPWSAKEARFACAISTTCLPLAPRTLDDILVAAAERTGDPIFWPSPPMWPRNLPPADRIDRRSVNRRHRDKEILRRMLDHEFREHPDWAEAVDRSAGRNQRFARRARRTARTAKLSAGILADWPSRTSTIAGSSTSTRWSACGWKTSACSPIRTR